MIFCATGSTLRARKPNAAREVEPDENSLISHENEPDEDLAAVREDELDQDSDAARGPEPDEDRVHVLFTVWQLPVDDFESALPLGGDPTRPPSRSAQIESFFRRALPLYAEMRARDCDMQAVHKRLYGEWAGTAGLLLAVVA